VFLDDISETPPTLDEGKLVLVEVAESTVRIGKESGDPYINLQVKVVDDEENEGAVMFDTLPLPLAQKEKENQKAYRNRMDRRCFKLKRAANAFKVPLNEGEQEEIAEAFLGRRAWTRPRLEKDLRGEDKSKPGDYYPENDPPKDEKK